MGYIDNNLMPGEVVTYRAKLHWIILGWPVFFLFGALLVSVLAGQAVFFGIGLLLALLTALPGWIKMITSEFGVTNKRVLVKVGWIHRHSLETFLTKVEGMQVDQEIFGRILNYGTITITGTGGLREQFHKIAAPLEFRRKVHEQISVTQGSR